MVAATSVIDHAPVRHDRARLLRYLVALLLGLGVSAALGYEALLSSLFDSCGERCPAEHARVARLRKAAAAAPLALVGACAVAELVVATVRARRRARDCPRPRSAGRRSRR